MALSSLSPLHVPCCYNLTILPFTNLISRRAHAENSMDPGTSLHQVPWVSINYQRELAFSGGRGLQLFFHQQGLLRSVVRKVFLSHNVWRLLFGIPWRDLINFCSTAILIEVGHRDEAIKSPGRERTCSRLSTETRRPLLLIGCPVHSTRLSS